MIFIRYVLALGLFLAGLFCIALMIVDGFDWLLTALAITAVFFARCFQPSSGRQDNSYSFAEEAGSSFIGEVIVQGLFNLITWPIRILFQALFD